MESTTVIQEEDEEATGEQKALSNLHQQRWAIKTRRRSSDMKSFLSDRLELADNTKLNTTMLKHGIDIIYMIIQ